MDTGARHAAALAALLCAGIAAAQDRAPALGLCPAQVPRPDSYMQMLCQGEAALRDGRAKEALAHFSAAATMPRLDASHELAWAGLAAAHCRDRDAAQARQWAARFNQARRLWLGELDCEAPAGEARAGLSPFVRSRMCSEPLLADYALVHRNPQADHAIELHARLARVAEAVAGACASALGAAKATTVKPPPKAAGKKKKRTQKRASP